MAATVTIYGVGFCSFSDNLSTKKLIKRRGNGSIIGVRSVCSRREVGTAVRCSSSSKAVAPLGSEGDGRRCVIEEEEEEEGGGDVMRFKMSDFKVLDRVSIGLGGRADEVVFEAIVKDSNSPLHNIKVVLRKLVSTQAKRRGTRAIEVLKKLARRKLMYHSYSMQVYGYISSPTSGRGSFTLVHGYHGSFSLRHWLQQSDWLPTLEATLALDEESVRRVGDDTVGGPAVSRQLRITRILMRDLLIGVNYLHSHGLAHTELRLENVHISPVDRHIKYHGSFSLRHWLQQSDRLPTLEANLALDEESVRRVGDDTVGGPAVSRQLQITQFFFETLASTIRLASYLGSQSSIG